MKLCVPVPCFFGDLPFAEAVSRISALGFDLAETYNWKKLDLDSAARALERSGVTLLSMCTTEFRMTDPSFRREWLDGLRESCEAARLLGVGKLITQVGPDTGKPRKEQHDSIVAALTAGAEILERYGVTVMIEPLNVLVNHPGYYLTSSAEAFDIVRSVSSEYVKVVFDIYHQQVTEGNIIPNVTRNLDCISHLHAAGHPGRNELQYGENDYRNVFAAIDRAGYTGACGLEYKPLMNPEDSLRTAKELYG